MQPEENIAENTEPTKNTEQKYTLSTSEQTQDRKGGCKKRIWRPVYNRVVLYEQKGLTHEEISNKTGLSLRQISRVMTHPEYKSRVVDIRKVTRDRVANSLEKKLGESSEVDKALTALVNKVPFATKELIKLAKKGTSKDRLRFDACKEILDRAGLKPPEVIETRERNYDPKEIESAKQVLAEIVDMTERITNQNNPFMLSQPREDIDEIEDIEDVSELAADSNTMEESSLTDDGSEITTEGTSSSTADRQETSPT